MAVALLEEFTDLGSVKGEGEGDWDLEQFFLELEVSGQLKPLREESRVLALKRKEAILSFTAQDSMSRQIPAAMSKPEVDEWDRWTATEEGSTSTDSEWIESDLDSSSSSSGTRQWDLKIGSGGEVMKAMPPSPSPSSLDLTALSGNQEEGTLVTQEDLENFLVELQVPEEQQAATGWRLVMNRSTETMQYTAYMREAPGTIGGTEYRGRMLVHGISPEAARDFMLDEAHRSEWDENRMESRVLQEWDETGSCVAQWVRRLPFFLRNREYVVSRRVWSLKPRTFHCISTLTNHPAAPLRVNPMRVKAFYSAWVCTPILCNSCSQYNSSNAASSLACKQLGADIVTYHYEESGLQREIARMGVARGMWAHIVKMEAAMRAYAASGRNARHLLPVFLLKADALVQRASADLPGCDVESRVEAEEVSQGAEEAAGTRS